MKLPSPSVLNASHHRVHDGHAFSRPVQPGPADPAQDPFKGINAWHARAAAAAEHGQHDSRQSVLSIYL
jgi:hypothetical protein